MTISTSDSAMSDRQRARLSQIEQAFSVSTDQLHKIVKQMRTELTLGLTRDNDSCLRMSPSFVHQRTTPQGTSLGMGIEASGRRIRITSVTFAADSTVTDTRTQVFVARPKSISAFFEHTAFCLRTFLQTQGLDDQILPLGITIGLPIDGSNVCQGAKEDSLDLCGRNVARHLCDTFLRAHLPVRVTSVTNNAVSRLVAARAEVAASFNHGINAAFMMEDGRAANTEIGRFASPALPLTMWDRRVDRESRRPGARPLEKLVADQYLGEIVRNLITDLMDEQLLFGTRANAQAISREYTFHTAYMAPIIEGDRGAILDNEFGLRTTEADCQVVRMLCKIVARRAALLAGAMLAALVVHTGGKAVALSGVLFDVNQGLGAEAVDTMEKLLGRPVDVLFQERGAEVLGAAINAASI
ncbi:hypothetical protein FBU31_001582 [Coemansia sp. 'formosensis']|nr:hypothetical protein FBU31_001582 [Coemansia sp. 'formosensis']